MNSLSYHISGNNVSFSFKPTGATGSASSPASPTCPGAPQCNVKVSQVCRIVSLLINCQNTLFVNGQTHLSYSQPISWHAFSRVLNLQPALNLQGHMIGSFHCLLRLWLTKEIPLFFFPNGTKICRGAFELLSVDTIIIIFSNCICKITVFHHFFSLFRIWWLLH